METHQKLIDKVQNLYDTTKSLAGESDHTRLLELTLQGAKRLTGADGGTLYTVTEDQTLKFEILVSESLGIKMGGSSRVSIQFDELPLYLDGKDNLHNVACYSVLKDEIVNIADAYRTDNFDFSGTRAFDKQTGYRSQSFLTIPLKNAEREIIGVLQLINSTDPETKEVVSFSEEDQKFTEFFASQAAITLSNSKLIQEQEELFVAFADVIATAIDDKSPHTGEHCKRVPEITMMLAEAAHEADYGIFTDFTMNDKQRHELHLAAVLHDCGKITTPVHIIEKATKLQTIVDCIEIVDLKFEILKRDQEISALKEKTARYEGKLGTALDCSDLDKQLEETKVRLDKERDFLRECNIGGEYMAEQKQKKVIEISKQTWMTPEGRQEGVLTFEEIKNLNIPKGTLTPEEREIINRHIDLTIKMLEKLPYPKHLKKIPEFAGGHHEKMDGTGRPKGLTRYQMPLEARIMGVAEIFEALTAKDRPYKKGKKLNDAFYILGKMKEDEHIDPDVFDLLIDSGVYMQYAEKFVDPDQIETVDYEAIPAFIPKERRDALEDEHSTQKAS